MYAKVVNCFVRHLKEFRLTIPEDIKKAVETISERYNGKDIIAEETEREGKTKKLIAEYKDKFINQPHLEIAFEKKVFHSIQETCCPGRMRNSLSHNDSFR